VTHSQSRLIRQRDQKLEAARELRRLRRLAAVATPVTVTIGSQPASLQFARRLRLASNEFGMFSVGKRSVYHSDEGLKLVGAAFAAPTLASAYR